jgi:hypothetical protein
VENAAYETTQTIYNATVEINLYPTGGKYYESGLGTLVSSAGLIRIVTHNHWGVIHNVEKVQVLASSGEKLLELSGSEFKKNLLYFDKGSMIFAVPHALSAMTAPLAAGLNENPAYQVGDRVAVVRRNSKMERGIEVITAKIAAIKEQQIPVLVLDSRPGDELERGDSGGGVWYKGELVGNNWAIIVDEKTWEQAEVKSPLSTTWFAAQLPGHYFSDEQKMWAEQENAVDEKISGKHAEVGQ